MKVCIVCKERFIFECDDERLYDNNYYCQMMSDIKTRKYIEANYIIVDDLVLDDEQICIYFDEPFQSFIGKYTYNNFLNLLLIVDKYSLNIDYINSFWITWFKHKELKWWDDIGSLICKRDIDSIIQKKLINSKVKPTVNDDYELAHFNPYVDKEYYDVLRKQYVQINKEDFNPAILDLIPETHVLHDVFSTSIAYCHYMVKQNRIKDPTKLYYAMRILDVEERVMAGENCERYLFTLDEVRNLPTVDLKNIRFNEHSMLSNPYISCINQYLDDRLYMNVPYNLDKDIIQTNTLNTAKAYIDIYTHSCLKHINWYKTALCGSIMPATCITRYNIPYNDFLIEYYPSTDSLKSGFDINDPKTYKGLSDIDMIIDTNDKSEFDQIVQLHFENIQKVNPNITLVLHKTKKSYKYFIYGLHRKIEIFMAPKGIPKTILGFHLDCVRAWYDGSQIYCFRSFITPAKTGINQYVRYIGNNNPTELFIKYFQRGFGTLLSSIDNRSILKYVGLLQNDDDIYIYRHKKSEIKRSINPSQCKEYGIHKYLDSNKRKIQSISYISIISRCHCIQTNTGKEYLERPAIFKYDKNIF